MIRLIVDFQSLLMKHSQLLAHETKSVDKDAKVVCKHKPGDVWAEGCCTTQKNKQIVEGENKARVVKDSK